MTKGRVLFASLIGTTIEFFDFYIYGTAAVLVFPQLFFPKSSDSAQLLQSYMTAINVTMNIQTVDSPTFSSSWTIDDLASNAARVRDLFVSRHQARHA